MSPGPSSPPTVRVFRLANGRLVLDDGHGRFDLTAHLARRGLPADLVDLCESGWFARSQLAPSLPSAAPDAWSPYRSDGDAAGDPNAPADTSPPLAPREVGKVLALGKNFREHAAEFGEAVPEELLFFNKLPETLAPHRGTTTVPKWYDRRVDHEAELAVVIGLAGKDIAVEDALEHVAGYTVANDLTFRSLQGDDRKKGHPWFRAKNADGFLPLGPCFVPRDFFDLTDQRVTARVNGELRQDASTRDLVIDVPHALAELSRHMTLRPGDIVLMGTPAGVGPLEDGDEVVCAVIGIGELMTHIQRP
jgi:2-keto-4-pentenoate hydratase/2-oxohepta-3-ene-1,7-dioic acid hydratase in catechol pathway